MKKILLFILLPLFSYADCVKNVKVETYKQKAIPSLFTFEKKKFKSKTKIISISCELYSTLKVGDILVDEKLDMNIRGNLFESPVEETKYRILNLKP